MIDTIEVADALDYLRSLPDEYVNCIVTSPPYYGLRDYGVSGQIGLEATIDDFTKTMVSVFREARRALRSDGTLWLNLGDSYSSGGKTTQVVDTLARKRTNVAVRPIDSTLPAKNLMMIPSRVAIALQEDGWILRSDIIWHKPNPVPEKVKDRPTKAHEYVFLLVKSPRYCYSADTVKEATANRRSVWTVATEPTPFAHFATFPRKLIEPMILAGCPAGGIVLDPFMGSGTTALVARKLGRHYLGCDLNPEYVRLALDRLAEPYQTALET